MTDRPTIVILGASGDMARRLLLPALCRLHARGEATDLRIVGCALEDWTTDQFRAHTEDALEHADGEFDRQKAQEFLSRLAYRRTTLDAADLRQLATSIEGAALFYLALPPGMFATAAEGLAEAGLNDERSGWRRLIIEKPFGTDLESARALNDRLHEQWRERQIFRIDHFLGKVTVQNLLVFRFANRFLEPVLNAQHVAQVQITVAETLGLEGRYRYYDGIGALRDMLQNHLMQLFTFTALEPPARWEAELLREHKVEVLRAVPAPGSDEVASMAVRGRYTAGTVEGRDVPGYLEEQGIPADSRTETFAAVRLSVDNWRWHGVPFYLRSGKRLGADLSEIAIQFCRPPTSFFPSAGVRGGPEPNWLVFTIRPRESVDLVAWARTPGLEMTTRPVTLHADYRTTSEEEPDPYEQLVLDALAGDHTPFLREDEVEWAWRVVEPVLEAWTARGQPDDYAAGSDGPPSQDAILLDGHRWRPLQPAERSQFR